MSAIGLHRVVSPAGVLPQAAERLDPSAWASGDAATDLVRTDPGVRMLFDARLAAD